jgi:hypothetical protein
LGSEPDSLIRAQISKLKNVSIVNSEKFTIKSALKSNQLEALKNLAKQIADSM